MTEATKRKLVTVLAWGSWMSALTLTGIVTYINVVRPITLVPTLFQRVASVFIIVLMGVGVAAGTSLSRMKLGDTITRVFEEGYRYGRKD